MTGKTVFSRQTEREKRGWDSVVVMPKVLTGVFVGAGSGIPQ